jgi:membrane protein DedA with SNARE-associated domain
VRKFAVASACGIALWNSLFIAVGYMAGLATAATNVSTLAFWILVIIIVGEGFAVALWRRSRRRTISQSLPPAAMPQKED